MPREGFFTEKTFTEKPVALMTSFVALLMRGPAENVLLLKKGFVFR